jgi:hypothetical protein
MVGRGLWESWRKRPEIRSGRPKSALKVGVTSRGEIILHMPGAY